MKNLRGRLLAIGGIIITPFAINTAVGYDIQDDYYKKFSNEQLKSKAETAIEHYKEMNLFQKTFYFGNYLRAKKETRNL